MTLCSTPSPPRPEPSHRLDDFSRGLVSDPAYTRTAMCRPPGNRCAEQPRGAHSTPSTKRESRRATLGRARLRQSRLRGRRTFRFVHGGTGSPFVHGGTGSPGCEGSATVAVRMTVRLPEPPWPQGTCSPDSVFAFDSAADGASDLSAPLPAFFGLPSSAASTSRYRSRGPLGEDLDPAEVAGRDPVRVVNVPNYPSSTDRISVQCNDFG